MINTGTYKNTKDDGTPSKTIVHRTDVGYIIRQRMFVEEPKGEKVLRTWKDMYYVERYIYPSFGTFERILQMISLINQEQNAPTS